MVLWSKVNFFQDAASLWQPSQATFHCWRNWPAWGSLWQKAQSPRTLTQRTAPSWASWIWQALQAAFSWPPLSGQTVCSFAVKFEGLKAAPSL